MSKTKSKKSKKRARASASLDRHFLSAIVGIALGAAGFYAKRSIDSKAATA